MKALVDTQTGLIRGIYAEPLNFSISGHYIIDIPSQISVKPTTNVVSDLLNLKVAAWKTLTGLASSVSDELLAVPNVDISTVGILSNRIQTGPNKKTVIQPGGVLVTNTIATAGGTKLYLHYNGYLLNRQVVDPLNPVNPNYPPARMLYSYDGVGVTFTTFQSSTFTVSIVNPNTPFATVSTPTPDTVVTSSVPTSFRLSFTNTSTQPYYLSDWILLYS